MPERSRPVLASLAAFPAIQTGRHPHHSPRCVRGHSHTSRPARSQNRPNDGPLAAECFSPMPLLPCTAGTPSGWTDGQPGRTRSFWTAPRSCGTRHRSSWRSRDCEISSCLACQLRVWRSKKDCGFGRHPARSVGSAHTRAADAGAVRLAERRASTGRVLNRPTRGHPFGSCVAVPGPNGT